MGMELAQESGALPCEVSHVCLLPAPSLHERFTGGMTKSLFIRVQRGELMGFVFK